MSGMEGSIPITSTSLILPKPPCSVAHPLITLLFKPFELDVGLELELLNEPLIVCQVLLRKEYRFHRLPDRTARLVLMPAGNPLPAV